MKILAVVVSWFYLEKGATRPLHKNFPYQIELAHKKLIYEQHAWNMRKKNIPLSGFELFTISSLWAMLQTTAPREQFFFFNKYIYKYKYIFFNKYKYKNFIYKYIYWVASSDCRGVSWQNNINLRIQENTCTWKVYEPRVSRCCQGGVNLSRGKIN